ncbi:hypothetical protein DXG01_005349 [Tephrocybe rancida]|nr:hypothetical protein DXG01_005349 [Tephrocybe rancida]
MQSFGQTFGQSLPDQVERIAALFDVHLELISDVRELYQGRAALEREYATKLQLLSKKAAEKKSRMEAALVLGEHPSKAWDPKSFTQNSLLKAYGELVDSMGNTAQDHVNIADGLTTQVIDVLRGVEKKNQDAQKMEMQFYQKLLNDRDRVYAERVKCKQKVNQPSLLRFRFTNEWNVSVRRRMQRRRRIPAEAGKLDTGSFAFLELTPRPKVRAQDDKHADRAAKQAEQQRNEMLNSKNAYLISIAVANNVKAQFYNTNLPALEDSPSLAYTLCVIELLQRRLVERFSKILQHSQSLQLFHLESLKGRVTRVDAAFGQADPIKDQDLFIDYNLRPFTAPDDWTFEPCSTHYDTASVSLCRSKLEELAALIGAKSRERDHLSKQVSSYCADHTLGSIDDTSAVSVIACNNGKHSDFRFYKSLAEVQHELAFFGSSEKILQTEMETISTAIGGEALANSLRPFIFLYTYAMRLLQDNYLGAEQAGEDLQALRHFCPFQMRTQVSSFQAPSASSFVSSRSSRDSIGEAYPTARVLFDFTPTSEFELEVAEGATVRVVEADDGSGWVKVANMRGKDGLVPASYLEHEVSGSVPPAIQGPAEQHVRAVYAYEAQGQDELDLVEGQTIELTSGPSGGQNYGNGWWEGVNSAGRRGIFPSNYVEFM